MGLPHPPADPRYASTYCGLKRLSASLPGGDYVPCSSQTRRFGVHVAKSPAELVQALLANVDTRGDYCGAKGPRGKVVAPNEARCASTRQLRKWGVLPTRGGYGVADDLAYGSNVMAGGNVDAALIPDMITRNHATLIHRALPVLRQPFHMAFKNYHARIRHNARMPVSHVLDANGALQPTQQGADAQPKSEGELIMSFAYVRRYVQGALTNIPIGWCFGRLARPGEQDIIPGTGERSGNAARGQAPFRAILFSLFVFPSYRGDPSRVADPAYANAAAANDDGTRRRKHAYLLLLEFEAAAGRFYDQHRGGNLPPFADLVQDDDGEARTRTRTGGPQKVLTIETFDAECMQGGKPAYEAARYTIVGVDRKQNAIKTFTRRS